MRGQYLTLSLLSAGAVSVTEPVLSAPRSYSGALHSLRGGPHVHYGWSLSPQSIDSICVPIYIVVQAMCANNEVCPW